MAEDTPTAEPEPDAVSEARFVEEDLECVKGLIGLQTITSLQEYDGSKQLFLFEQLTHLDRCGTSHLGNPPCSMAQPGAGLEILGALTMSPTSKMSPGW